LKIKPVAYDIRIKESLLTVASLEKSNDNSATEYD